MLNGLGQTMKNCKLGLFDQFYSFLEKLRVGTLNQVLADNFNVSQTTVSQIFITWANFLYFMLGSFAFGHLGPRFRNACQTLSKKHIQVVGKSSMPLKLGF